MTRRVLPALLHYEIGSRWRGYHHITDLLLADWHSLSAGRYW